MAVIDRPAPSRSVHGNARNEGDSRSIRVFISSTYLDMQRERDILVRQTFPALRAHFRARGVEVLEMDLRWGITQEQAESGATVPICLSEVDRCRPWFIGLIGERHGWAPPEETYTDALKAAFPAIAGSPGSSITELEAIHGVLSDPEALRQAIFLMRDPAWIEQLPPWERADYLTDSAEARERHARFKRRIEASGARIIRYGQPEDIGPAVERALGAALDARFPPDSAPDDLTRDLRLHAAYARERRGIHVGAEPYLAALDGWAADAGAPLLVVTGASGSGKSALIANWLAAYRRAFPSDIVFEHYLGASPDSADPALLMRRLWRHLDRATGETAPPPPAQAPLMEIAAGLAQRLARASLHAGQQGATIIIALDGLDKLSSEQNLRWLPRLLPPRIKLLASSLDGEALRTADARRWRRLEIKALTPPERLALIERMLSAWGRKLSRERTQRITAHPLAATPLFIRTVLEELRYSAIHDRLDARIDFYLGATTMPELFGRMLARLEDDGGAAAISGLLLPVWASRAGLEEADIVAISGSPPLTWAAVRNGLGDALRDQQGRLTFSHDFLRQAVEERYAPTQEAQRAAHLRLAEHFEAGPLDARQAEEVPFQLRTAGEWERLEQVLTDLDRLALLRERGDVELLGYWLPLSERGRDPETLLCEAFATRAGSFKGWGEAELGLASALGKFLESAGARGRASQDLAEKRTQAYSRLFGKEHPDTLTSANNLAQVLLARGDLAGAEGLFAHVFQARRRVLGRDHADTLSALNNLAQAITARGEPARARELQQQALDAARRLFGPDHADTLTNTGNLAHILAELGDFPAARALLETALETSTRQLGPEHPDTLSCAHNFAGILKAQGDLAGAETLLAQIFETRLRLLGPDHPHTLTSLNNLASVLIARGDPQGARRPQERVLEAATRLAGAEHPDTLIAMNNLAQTVDDLGDADAARELFRRAARLARRHLGSEHPITLSALNNLAQSVKGGGDVRSAMRLEQKLLETRLRVSGPDHPLTLTVMNNLAQSCIEAGVLELALTLSRKVVAASERRLGPEHPDTLTAMHNQASAMLARGDLAGALHIFSRVIEARTRLLGPDHPDTLSVLGNQASALEARGDVKAARDLYDRVLGARMRLLGTHHPDTLMAMNALAGALRACGDLPASQTLLERVLTAMQNGLGMEHPSTLAMLGNFASTLKARGDWEGAQKLEERAAAARERVSGPEHPDTLTALNNLAQTCYSRGDHARARPLFERVLAARMRVNGPEHLHTLTCLVNLAQTRKAQGDLDGAHMLEERALSALMRVGGQEHPLTLTCMSNLAGTLRFRGDMEGARDLEQQAFDARVRLLGPDHPDTLTSMSALGEIAHRLGDIEAAGALFEPLAERRSRVLGEDHPDTLASTMSLGSIVWALGDFERAARIFTRAFDLSAARLGPGHRLTEHARGALARLERLRAEQY